MAFVFCLLAVPLVAGSAPRVIQGKYDKKDTVAINLNFSDISANDQNSVLITTTQTIRGFKYFSKNTDFTTITGDTLDFSSGTVDSFYASTVTASYITVTQTAAADSVIVKDGATTVMEIYDGGIVDFPLQSAARAYRAANVSNGVGTSATKVSLSSETFDTQGEFDSATNYRFTATKAGIYSAKACVESTGLGAANLRLNIFIYVNGAEHTKNVAWSSGTGDISVCTSDEIQLAAAGYIELYTSTSAAAAKDLTGGSSRTFLAVNKDQ